MTDNQAYLEYIRECIERINEYTYQGREVFLANSMIQDAVLRRLQTLAESTQRLSDDLKTRVTEVNWRSISGFRNVLVHDYLGGIDLNIVWDVIDQDLPDLKKKIEVILQELAEE